MLRIICSGCLVLGLAMPGLTARPNLVDWSFQDLTGKTHRPFAEANIQAVVVVFIALDCPVANYYQPTLGRYVKEFASKGVHFFYIHPDPTVTKSQAEAHAREYSLAVPVVLDPEHQWVDRLKAKITPEAFVLDPSGKILYRGRIDDTYLSWGKKRRRVQHHDLRDALRATLAGDMIRERVTEPVGCFIPDIDH